MMALLALDPAELTRRCLAHCALYSRCFSLSENGMGLGFHIATWNPRRNFQKYTNVFHKKIGPIEANSGLTSGWL
jgi:hypothetical protein